MRSFKQPVAAALALAAAFGFGLTLSACDGGGADEHDHASHGHDADGHEHEHEHGHGGHAGAAPMASAMYVCPMHPEATSDKPGRCPKCGMDLVMKTQGEKTAGADGGSHDADGHAHEGDATSEGSR